MSLRSCGLQGVLAEMGEAKKKRPISSYATALRARGEVRKRPRPVNIFPGQPCACGERYVLVA